MAPQYRQLPVTEKMWHTGASQNNATDRSVNNQTDAMSASNFKEKDFYSLRVLTPEMRGIKDSEALNEFVSKENREAATLRIREDPEWLAYLERIAYTTDQIHQHGLDGVGKFTGALTLNSGIGNDSRAPTPEPSAARSLRPRPTRILLEIVSSSSSDDSSGTISNDEGEDPTWIPAGSGRTRAGTRHAIDEQNVHVACWSLLSHMLMSDAEIRMSWWPTQIAFHPPFTEASTTSTAQQPASSTTARHMARLKRNGVYQAKVDGAALGWDSGECFAISEVKKSRRYAGNGDLSPEKSPNRRILMQEAAEMAAWIAERPPSWGKRKSGSKT